MQQLAAAPEHAVPRRVGRGELELIACCDPLDQPRRSQEPVAATAERFSGDDLLYGPLSGWVQGWKPNLDHRQ
jgi:hypothetical protein